MTSFYIGCAVWAYKEWVGDLFPPGSKSSDFLRLYSRRLSAVEGNTTFYATPKLDIVQRWAEETPPDFRFCFKLPRQISHSGPLAARSAETQAFVTQMAALGERLGPFFVQLPPGYGPARIGDLERWLAAWPQDFDLAVEVRHAGWYDSPGEAALMDLLDRYSVGRVLMDVRPIRTHSLPVDDSFLDEARERKPNVPLHPLRSGDIAMIRYIGHPEPALNDAWLNEWAVRMADWLAEGAQVYCFMHCPDERRSPALCRALHRRLEQQTTMPPLPWNILDEGLRQNTLF
ncbi:MAG: DUF72 domain-containing protein [Chloroflexales bacterium]|nr:DUF72 domain-containing protein [Chloroflexales bacterium]